MATAAQVTFTQAVGAALGVKQVADAAALATYAFVPANLAAYIAALVTNRNAFISSVTTAAATAGMDPGPVLNGQWNSVSSSMTSM